MKSLGAELKAAREKKAFSCEQISRDTNIARRYLEALEEEDFSLFPGEPYLLGFLRNYADYLGLDSTEILNLYKNMKIQEAPIPVEALLRKPFPLKKLLISLGIVLFLLALGIGLAVFSLNPGKGKAIEVNQSTEEESIKDYVLEQGYLEKRLFKGDAVLVHYGGEVVRFVIADLSDVVTVDGPGGRIRLELGQEEHYDLNGDGHGDIAIFIADLYKNRPEKGVSLRAELLSSDTQALPASFPQLIRPMGEEVVEGSAGQSATSLESVSAPSSATSSSRPVGGNALFTSPATAWPFTLQATFRGYCMFRWEVDRKERDERYFHKTETLTVQARNGVRLWISNAAAVKLTAIGGGRSVDVDLGRAGEVVVVDIKWVRDEDNQYRLISERID